MEGLYNEGGRNILIWTNWGMAFDGAGYCSKKNREKYEKIVGDKRDEFWLGVLIWGDLKSNWGSYWCSNFDLIVILRILQQIN